MDDHGSAPVKGHESRDQSSFLFQCVYERLRALARSRMGQERLDHTLQPTALVHEAFLRMMGGGAGERAWDDRAQFYAAAAEAMRRILVDAARRRRRIKRGGSLKRVGLLDFASDRDTAPKHDLLALNDALDALAAEHPEKAYLVKLRYFGGLTLDEASERLGISHATADRHWVFARAWLYRHIEGSTPPRTHELGSPSSSRNLGVGWTNS